MYLKILLYVHAVVDEWYKIKLIVIYLYDILSYKLHHVNI